MDHVNTSTKKANIALRNLVTNRRFGFSHFSLLNFYKQYILSILEYARPVWHPELSKEQRNDLDNLQKRAARVILGSEFTNYDDSLKILGLERLDARRHQLTMAFGQKLLESNKNRGLLPKPAETGYNKRHQNKLKPRKPLVTDRYRLSFRHNFVSHFNK